MRMRNGIFGIDDAVAVVLIGLLSTIITVVFEKETNNSFTKIIYQDDNLSECIKKSDIIQIERD